MILISPVVRVTKETTMSLYSESQYQPSALSQNEFIRRHKVSAVISTESVSTFLGQFKDTVSNLVSVVTLQSPDKVVSDVIGVKHQTLAKAKEVSFANFRHVVISKPESFKGVYTDYLGDLTQTAQAVFLTVNASTDRLKMLLASFINEYTDQTAETVYGHHLFVKETKELETLKKIMGGYFTAASNKSKTTPDEVLKSMNDFAKLFDQLSELGRVLTEDRLKQIDRDSKNLVEMVDLLIEHNIKSNILSKNNTAKKELMECIHATAQQIEFFNALFAQLMFFCGAFKGLTTALNDF